MKRLWYNIFPKWEDYKIYRGVWKGKTQDDMGDFIDWIKHCKWHIQYSKRLDLYRVRTFGYRPKDHPKYDEVLQKMKELNGKRDY